LISRSSFEIKFRDQSFAFSKETLMVSLIFLVILVVIAVVLIGMYNSLVQLRVRCDSAWSDIDVQLKRRHDLIPNLVETVKGYAAHEKGTFENIAKFRSQAMQATTPEGKAVAENQLSGALKSLFAVAENYPELKASEEFTQLQRSLSQTEDSIQNSRSYYNMVVRDLNTRIQVFPTNILAGMFGFQGRGFFETSEAEREPVAVKF
jgi:LemA protein